MEKPILAHRRELLMAAQNPDGGWGYYAGKKSWLEPTAYAMLALDGEPSADAAVRRAWQWVSSLQSGDGGWRPAAHVNDSTWVTALAVILCTIKQEYGHSFQQGVRWMLRMTGQESALFNRMVTLITGRSMGRDASNRGWPWLESTTAWVEPTALSLVALRRAAASFHDVDLKERIREGEDLLLTVRGRDGGWNYGSASALGVDLPSFAETTAVALIGLQHRVPGRIVFGHVAGSSRLANAWLAIARMTLNQGGPLDTAAEAPQDLMVAALEAIAAPGGAARVFRTESAI